MPYSATPFGFEACLVNKSSALLAYWDKSFVCRFANDAYGDWFGLSPGTMVGKGMEEIIGQEELTLTRQHMGGALAGQLLPTQSHPSGAMGKRHGLASFQADRRDGQVIGYIAEIRDTSSQKELECVLDRLAQLKEQMLHIRRATDAAQLGLWHWDQATDEVSWKNNWPHEILGIPLNSPPVHARKLAREFLSAEQDEELYDAVRKALCRNEGFRFLGQVRRRRDGQLRWIELIGGAEGARALDGTIVDVTERVEALEAMRQALAELTDLDVRKNDFLAILGHELRNCLAPLQTGIRSIRQSPTGCAPVKLQDVMERQVQHLGRLIDDIFDIRLIASGELQLEQQVVSLHQVVSESIEMCRCLVERARHSLRYHIHDEEVEVRGDPVRLAQIFSNIIGNAVKFTPPSGTIDICVAVENGTAVVSVTDNGVGMSEAELQSVFGLYARANKRNCRAADGLGIGLHLVRTLTELQGGTVDAVSPGPGRGTTLIVRLPCTW